MLSFLMIALVVVPDPRLQVVDVLPCLGQKQKLFILWTMEGIRSPVLPALPWRRGRIPWYACVQMFSDGLWRQHSWSLCTPPRPHLLCHWKYNLADWQLFPSSNRWQGYSSCKCGRQKKPLLKRD